jgi:hypothetical protein
MCHTRRHGRSFHEKYHSPGRCRGIRPVVRNVTVSGGYVFGSTRDLSWR